MDYSEDCAFVKKILCDEKSKDIYARLWQNMKCGRVIDLSLYENNQYFPNDIISSFKAGEVIADAGSCKGEEIDRALSLNGDIEIHSFEPDSRSRMFLNEKYNNEPRVHIYEYALWKERAKLDLSLSATPESSRLNATSVKTSGGGAKFHPARRNDR